MMTSGRAEGAATDSWSLLDLERLDATTLGTVLGVLAVELPVEDSTQVLVEGTEIPPSAACMLWTKGAGCCHCGLYWIRLVAYLASLSFSSGHPTLVGQVDHGCESVPGPAAISAL